MPEKFHKHFNITISKEQSQRRFINRVCNDIWGTFLSQFYKLRNHMVVTRAVFSHLGARYDRDCNSITDLVGDDFLQNLQAIESMYDFLRGSQSQEELDYLVTTIITQAEIDLGIRWKNGQFYQSGSELLDEKAVNDVLGLLNNPAHVGAAQAFHLGLDHFLHSTKKPNLLSDVVIHMHEALEATAQVICDNNKTLAGNAQAFASKMKLPDSYTRFLKEYIKYANELHRHAAGKGKPKSLPSRREVSPSTVFLPFFRRRASNNQLVS